VPAGRSAVNRNVVAESLTPHENADGFLPGHEYVPRMKMHRAGKCTGHENVPGMKTKWKLDMIDAKYRYD